MTVAELIEHLKEMPQDLEVFLNVNMACREGYSHFWNSIEYVFVQEDFTNSPITKYVTLMGGKNEP